MIRSMTGYGKARYEDEFTSYVEIKSLNSKFLDASIRLPKVFSDKEMEVRSILSNELVRGKVNIYIEFESSNELANRVSFNKELFQSYYSEMKAMAEAVGADAKDTFRLAMQVPEVMKFESDQELLDKFWKVLVEQIKKAASECDQFRLKEGESLRNHLIEYVSKIRSHREEIIKLDPNRISRIKERINGNLKEFIGEADIDQNRFEQELIYYIEKLDIQEELVRLNAHLDHFEESLNADSVGGKKLGFISQEIGREINTIGSKANDSNIQSHVINMKEELEKIKEQTLNIL